MLLDKAQSVLQVLSMRMKLVEFLVIPSCLYILNPPFVTSYSNIHSTALLLNVGLASKPKNLYNFPETTNLPYLRFEVLIAVKMSVLILCADLLAVKLDALSASEMVSFCKSTWCYNPEDQHQQITGY
jgi:hypothetical protein